jgi:hypothetical protein
MTQFKISPLIAEKPIKKRKISWLWLIIFLETLAAGTWIFRLQERLAELEQQLLEQTNGRKEHVQ